MCVCCAAIPVAAATGVRLNTKQSKARHEAEEAGQDAPQAKPIMIVTAGIVFLLLIGSVTYHTLTYLP